MFSALHELLVNHLASIVGASFDVNGLFDDGIRATTESLSSPILNMDSERSELDLEW